MEIIRRLGGEELLKGGAEGGQADPRQEAGNQGAEVRNPVQEL